MLTINQYLCSECGACIPICPLDAIRLHLGGLEIDHNLCDFCNICVVICPTDALVIEEKQLETV